MPSAKVTAANFAVMFLDRKYADAKGNFRYSGFRTMPCGIQERVISATFFSCMASRSLLAFNAGIIYIAYQL